MRESSERKGEILGEGDCGTDERKHNQPINWNKCPRSEELVLSTNLIKGHFSFYFKTSIMKLKPLICGIFLLSLEECMRCSFLIRWIGGSRCFGLFSLRKVQNEEE
jgi:hypothetical protein